MTEKLEKIKYREWEYPHDRASMRILLNELAEEGWWPLGYLDHTRWRCKLMNSRAQEGERKYLILEAVDSFYGYKLWVAYYANNGSLSDWSYEKTIYAEDSPNHHKYYPDRSTLRDMHAYEGCIALGNLGLSLDFVKKIRWLELD